jgi:hypothetical protein
MHLQLCYLCLCVRCSNWNSFKFYLNSCIYHLNLEMDAGDWCLIESDPGVFTQLIKEFGMSVSYVILLSNIVKLLKWLGVDKRKYCICKPYSAFYRHKHNLWLFSISRFCWKKDYLLMFWVKNPILYLWITSAVCRWAITTEFRNRLGWSAILLAINSIPRDSTEPPNQAWCLYILIQTKLNTFTHNWKWLYYGFQFRHSNSIWNPDKS